MINHPHSCPRFEFCSRYHSFCANFSQWKVCPGRRNRAPGHHVTRIEFAFSFLTRGKTSFLDIEWDLYRSWIILALLYFLLSIQMRSCLDTLFYAHLFPVDKKVSIKINDEMRRGRLSGGMRT